MIKNTKKPAFNKSLFDYGFGEYKPAPEEMHEYTEKMIRAFIDFFSEKGYKEIPSVTITSGIDPTVRFVGSHISPMKKYFLENKIPKNGLVMSQQCVRTQNLQKIFNDSIVPAWGSYFKSLGVLVIPEKISELCDQSLDYLLNVINIPKENLVLRVNNTDKDLYRLAKTYTNLGISFDDTTMPEKYYRHKVGVNGVWGRNFNYSIKKEGVLHDIGNLIVLENNEKQLGVELALGTSTILKHFFSLDHVNSANPVLGIQKINDPLKFKFEDTIITSSMLLSEGLRPSANKNRERILRSYLRAMIYFKNKFKISTKATIKMMREFEECRGINHQGSEFISSYIPEIEKKILIQDALSPEEGFLLSAIKENI